MSSSMRTGPAAADPQFRGIDPAALGHLLKQMSAADRAIQAWLAAHPPPPGVSAAGHRRAQEVSVWVTEQLSMLTRRYNFAITHPDPGGGVRPGPGAPPLPSTPPSGGHGGPGGPRWSPPRPSPPPRQPRGLTPKGAGPDTGVFTTRRDAQRAARLDAQVVRRNLDAGRELPDDVWRRLAANAHDPDYTEELYDRLGPAGVADLIAAAAGNADRLGALADSLGTASFHLGMNAAWIRAVLAEADRDGTRDVVLRVLLDADMSPRTDGALARLGLLPGAAPAPPRAS
ncbi:MAG TPA: hypothetical protein VHJ17_13535 [Thermomonospora sp.]|nr:hypothetical protein [Thermomonospora sp.]